MKLISSWSGGKDSCYALMQALPEGHEIVGLLNMMNENNKVSRSHALSHSILNQQARAIGVPLLGIPSTWGDYENNYIQGLTKLKALYQAEGAVFGDIDIDSHRKWEEKVSDAAQLKALLPLWQKNRRELVLDMIASGIKAMIVSCNTQLGISFLGREITKELVVELEAMGIDACGENGEYHTLVLDCPLFSKPIELPNYTKVQHQDYCFINWKT